LVASGHGITVEQIWQALIKLIDGFKGKARFLPSFSKGAGDPELLHPFCRTHSDSIDGGDTDSG